MAEAVDDDEAGGPDDDVVVEIVRAAGGAVWRWGSSDIEVLLVHRPAYDDWTLPKGKVLPGEDDEDAAIREVAEETGYECELGAELLSTHYVDNRGRQKVVRYWAMEVYGEGAPFRANREIDRLAWLGPQKAMDRLSYDRDRDVLDSLLDATG